MLSYTSRRIFYSHPDAIIGECVDQIGNITMHPPTRRDWPHNPKNGTYHGWILPGWGRGDDYSEYHADHKWFEEKHGHKPYPLYFATDIRMKAKKSTKMVQKKDGSPTAFHCEFPNFG
eukprot:scaffold40270_cov33-Cyclotella_meneghiniana.AAC.2